MKIWNSYGSEHSANLVMIGRFKDTASAEKAKVAIDEISKVMISRDEDNPEADRFPEEIMGVLRKIGLYSVTPGELEQFKYDVHVKLKDNQLIVSTDEIDVSAFLKLMVDRGARVEVYSASYYPESTKEEPTEL